MEVAVAVSNRPENTEKSGSGRADGDRVGGGLDDRRRKLETALSAKRGGGTGKEVEGRSGDASGMAQALRLSSEFIAGILVGAGIGWLIDRFAGTSPWGLIVFLLLGFAAGVLNVLRSAGLVADTGSLTSRGDDEGPEN
jgi:ATP synthase protein I